MSGGGFSMDSIPPGVKKTIQDIKEISRIHTEEEIYTMLQECSMDPNETVQKLLSQDTFHEVKRKRDRKKENMNREPADSRGKQGMQRREGRSGRGPYPSRYISHDSGVSRNFSAGKENGISQVTEKGITFASSLGTHATENDSGVLPSSSMPGVTNGPTKSALIGSSQESGSQMPDGGGFPLEEESSIAETKSENAVPPPVDVKSGPENLVGVMHGRPVQSSYQFPSPGDGMQASVSGVYASATDPLLVPSPETLVPGIVGTIKREVASERTSVDPTAANVASSVAAGSEISSSEKAASEMGSSSIQGKLLAKPQVIDVNNLSDATQPSSSSSQFGSSGSMPSPNYSSRTQQIISPHKVGPSKEWKPKPTSQVPPHVSGTIGTSDVVPDTVEMNSQSSSGAPEEAMSKLQKKMEELHFSDDQHVIIPNHLQVPESERTGFSFGSFDANFTLETRFMNGPCNEKCSLPLTDSSQVPEENIEKPILSTQNAPTAQEEDFPDDPRSPSQMPQSLSSGEADISSISAVSEYDQNKQEAAVAQEGPQFSVVHTAPTYSTFGLVPPMLGNQFAPFENSEPQARDAPSLPSFIVQQPFDPSTGYYTQIYPSGGDNNGRFSPFLAPDTAAKYNGNLAILPAQTGQTSQESANSIVLPTTGATPVVTQAVGVMQTSLAVTQQPVPVFRQPAGVHISHYPPNYIPYQYFSPFYVPPTIQHFLSNPAFLQQPLAGSMYPPPAAPATTSVKNSLSQYKTGTNSSNSILSGMPTGYGPYGSTPTGYSPSPSVTSGNSTGNEDIAGPQYKENDVYITGQQSEGSAVWVPAPGRDISSMQTSSLYNLPPQGQHMTFTPLQAGHGAFNGIYHPTQSVAAATVHPLLQPSQTMAGALEMVGRPGVYQQPQRAQINWASNY